MRAARKRDKKCGSQLGHNVNLQVLRVNVEETESAGASYRRIIFKDEDVAVMRMRMKAGDEALRSR